MAQIIIDSSNNLIQGDFDNATVNNRTKFKTTTLNGTTNVYAVPNGSSTSAGYSVSNNADPTNASKITIATNGATDTQIISGINGSGSYLPLSFYTNNTLGMQLSTAGNLAVTGGITVGATAAPAFSANLSGATTISLSSYVKVPFNSEVIDTNNNYDPTTNYRFTPTVAGYYQITLIMIGSASATGQFSTIYKNGVQETPGTMGVGVSGIGSGTMATGLISMNGTTDYVEAYVYQTGNGALSHSVGGCNFSGFLARSA